MAVKDITDLQVCQAVFLFRDEAVHPSTIDLLQASTRQPGKVCLRALERACRRGLIDYGTSINVAFLTPEGEAMLRTEAWANREGFQVVTATQSCVGCRWWKRWKNSWTGDCTFPVVTPECSPYPIDRTPMHETEGSTCQLFKPKEAGDAARQKG